jgi:hypothetical protein
VLVQVVRAFAQGAVQRGANAQYDYPGAQPPRSITEFHYLMRQLGPVAARHLQLFTDAVKRNFRVKVPPPKKSECSLSCFFLTLK